MYHTQAPRCKQRELQLKTYVANAKLFRCKQRANFFRDPHFQIMRRHTTTIAFRVSNDILRAIDAQREPFGTSRGEWVRGIIITWLNLLDQNRQIIPNDAQTIEALQSKLEEISRNQAKSVYMLLTALGNVSHEDALTLVKRQLLSEEDDA